MGSLPREVTGVGSGALNTLRQVGFSIGVAVLVAIFTAQMTTNVENAVREARKYVAAQSTIPAPARAAIDAQLQNAAEQARSGSVKPQDANDLLTAEPAAQDGSPQAQMAAKLQETLGGIFKENIAKSFSWPYYAAAFMAYLAVIPALLTGRRVGEHQGHHERPDESRTASRERVDEPEAG
jgi:hypothetical protein